MLYRPQVAYSLKESSLVTNLKSLKMKSFVECGKNKHISKVCDCSHCHARDLQFVKSYITYNNIIKYGTPICHYPCSYM